MMRLLRSCFKADPGDDEGLLLQNYFVLAGSKMGFESPEDNAIWTFIQEFVQSFNHVPDLSIISEHFGRKRENEVVDRLDVFRSVAPMYRGNFKKHLEEKAEARRTRNVITILKDANQINQKGMEVGEHRGKKLMKGPIDAIRHVIEKGHDIVAPTVGTRLYGEVTKDGKDFLDEYDLVKADPLSGIGQHTGLKQIDDALGGAKKHELWTHAAFTGGLKSTLMLNWAYNQAIYYGHSSMVFSLEMPYSQCRRIVVAMHSYHEKFHEIRVQLGLQEPEANQGLPYKGIRDGALEAAQEEFLRNYVVPDLMDMSLLAPPPDSEEEPEGPAGGYGKIHIEVADPMKDDFTVPDLRSKAELIYSKDPFSMIFVDHMGLMAPRKWVPKTTERLNEVVRDLKRMAMNFNRGSGIAVVGLAQLSREGFRAAEKNGGFYNLTHLSYSNEIERSSDVVTSTFVNDELRKHNRARVQNLKARDDKPFEPFYVRIEWECRRMLTCYDVDEMIVGKPDSEIEVKAEELGDILDS